MAPVAGRCAHRADPACPARRSEDHRVGGIEREAAGVHDAVLDEVRKGAAQRHLLVLVEKYPLRKSPSKLDSFGEILAHNLAIEATKGREQRRTQHRLYADLVALGYVGSYDRVAAFARNWRRQQLEREQLAGRGTYVPLRFAPGEAFQFDLRLKRAVPISRNRYPIAESSVKTVFLL